MAQGGVVIAESAEVTSAYEEVRADGNETNWLCLNYDDKTIVLKGTGKGYDEMCENFGEDERCYAYYRMTTGDEMSVRAKFILFTWIGPKVLPLKKAKVSTDKAFVKAIIKEYSIEILADDKRDFDEQEVRTKVETSSGAKY